MDNEPYEVSSRSDIEIGHEFFTNLDESVELKHCFSLVTNASKKVFSRASTASSVKADAILEGEHGPSHMLRKASCTIGKRPIEKRVNTDPLLSIELIKKMLIDIVKNEKQL
jgi:hypothetical protein